MRWIVEQEYYDSGKVSVEIVEDDGRIITPCQHLASCDKYEDVFEDFAKAQKFAAECRVA